MQIQLHIWRREHIINTVTEYFHTELSPFFFPRNTKDDLFFVQKFIILIIVANFVGARDARDVSHTGRKLILSFFR